MLFNPNSSSPLVDILANYLIDLDENVQEWQKKAQHSGQASSSSSSSQAEQSPFCAGFQLWDLLRPDSRDATDCKLPKQQSGQTCGAKQQKTADGSGLFTAHFDLGAAFQPSEVSVKLDQHTLVVSGRHEVTADQDGGQYELRQYLKKVTVPDTVVLDQLTSKLDSDGRLTVRAPLKTVTPPTPPSGHNIPVEFVNQPAQPESESVRPQTQTPTDTSDQTTVSEKVDKKVDSEFDIEDLGTD